LSYVWDGGVESGDLEVGVGGRGAVPLHGYQPGGRHLVGVLGRKRHMDALEITVRSAAGNKQRQNKSIWILSLFMRLRLIYVT